MNKKIPQKEEQINIDGRVAIAVAVTLAVLVMCLIVMFVGVALDASDSGGAIMSSSGGGGGGKNNSVQSNTQTPTSAPSAKTGMQLPSATKSGTYRFSSNDNTVEITDASIQSAAIALVDITDGRVVAMKNGEAKVYPASMTKVMTLLVACEKAKDPSALLTVTKEMTAKYAKEEYKGASVAFNWQEGNQVTVEDALHLVIYYSDTYACWLLAEHIAGSEEAFVKMMNDKATKELGCTSTNFTNCTGIYNENHYTTCLDMAAIMAAAMNNTVATAVLTSTSMYTVDIYENGEKTETKDMWCQWYTERLEKYRWGEAAPYYAGNGSDIKIIGGKTGYETLPSCCFVTSAIDTETNRRYVCVQVGRTDSSQTKITEKISTDDTRIVYQKYAVE